MLGGIKSVWETLSNLPLKIKESLSGLFDNIKNAITALPTTILNGIKDIFIPDVEDLESRFNEFIDSLGEKFNFDTDFFTSVFSEEKPVEDVYADYAIPGVGTFKFKFFDSQVFAQGVEYFRPFIRGFLIFLMALYNIKMILSFIRQDAGIVTGKAVEISNGERSGKH